jgi:Fe-S cluster assembly scaffold protein SufB
VTEVADPSTAASPRPRPARTGPQDLTYRLDATLVDRLATAEPAWLADERRRARAAYDALPVEPNRLYTPYVDLRAAALVDVVASEAPTAPAAVPAAGVADGLAVLAAFEEDRQASIVLSEAASRAGVTVETLDGLVRRDPDTARRLISGATGLAVDDKLAQLSLAAWTQGAVVRVPAGVVLDQPVVVRWTVGAPGRALHARTIVELGDGAEASLVEELVPADGIVAGRQALFTNTTEIRLGSGARLGMASLQELGPDQVVFQQRIADLGDDADLRWALAQLGGRLVRSRVDNVLTGDRSRVEQVEIVFGAEAQLHDLTSYTRHVGRDTTGQLLSKGVLLDRARSYLKGLITIEKSAVGTDSYLGEFGMNLSKSARAVAIPSLEIDQPDCRRAAHASSVGPIDETQLFYLESRGIPPDEARKFIVLGFLEPVVTRVPLEDARNRLRAALESKWADGLAAGSRSGGAAA